VLGNTIKFLTPRAQAAAELTGPSLYRFVDHAHPTLLVEEAGNLLKRRPDLMRIINAGWTPGVLIPRQEHGRTRWFDPRCCKVIIGVKVQLERETRTRCIEIHLLPKLPNEKFEDFKYVDDDDFLVLRRKLARWSADNAAALKEARPTVPGLNNRTQVNWQMLVAIADLAGGDWPKRARAAAIKLASKREELSEGLRLLAALRPMVVACEEIASKEIVRCLQADPMGEWTDFRDGGPVTERQVAAMLKWYGIFPTVLHPTKRRDVSCRGYKSAPILKMCAHYLQSDLPGKDPNIRTPRKRRKG
jgi:putative DNA primase/helicase